MAVLVSEQVQKCGVCSKAAVRDVLVVVWVRTELWLGELSSNVREVKRVVHV